MNYNTQQIFWGVFSSNHVEQHLPYVELCENLLEMSRSFAREKFGMPGAFFPHSAYPVPSQTIPYPVPRGDTKCVKRRGRCRACGGTTSTPRTKIF